MDPLFILTVSLYIVVGLILVLAVIEYERFSCGRTPDMFIKDENRFLMCIFVFWILMLVVGFFAVLIEVLGVFNKVIDISLRKIQFILTYDLRKLFKRKNK